MTLGPPHRFCKILISRLICAKVAAASVTQLPAAELLHRRCTCVPEVRVCAPANLLLLHWFEDLDYAFLIVWDVDALEDLHDARDHPSVTAPTILCRATQHAACGCTADHLAVLPPAYFPDHLVVILAPAQPQRLVNPARQMLSHCTLHMDMQLVADIQGKRTDACNSFAELCQRGVNVCGGQSNWQPLLRARLPHSCGRAQAPTPTAAACSHSPSTPEACGRSHPRRHALYSSNFRHGSVLLCGSAVPSTQQQNCALLHPSTPLRQQSGGTCRLHEPLNG